MTINGLHHAAISTPDIERLMKWYSKNFGFEEVSRSPRTSEDISKDTDQFEIGLAWV